jgi:ABC-type phosphate transport system ATPase subunit
MVEDKLVEEVKSSERALKALIWISHSGEQVQRIGNRTFDMAEGKLKERGRLV